MNIWAKDKGYGYFFYIADYSAAATNKKELAHIRIRDPSGACSIYFFVCAWVSSLSDALFPFSKLYLPPDGYIKVAVENGLAGKFNAAQNEPLTRWQVAEIVFGIFQ